MRKIKAQEEKTDDQQKTSKNKKAEALDNPLQYLDKAIKFLKADISNLPRKLCLNGEVVLYTWEMRK